MCEAKTARIHVAVPGGLKIPVDRRSVGPMEDKKLIDIEIKLAHQEYVVAELNDALSSQQLQIANLEARVSALFDRIKALSDVSPGGETGDERPPHY